MPAINFPNSPVNDEIYVVNNISYIYNSATNAWSFLPQPFADSFTDLTDTPEAYIDQAGKIVAVNQTATGLEFITGAAAPQFAKTYFYEGTVTVETGDIRLYLHRNATLKKIKVSVVVAGTTDSILQILKNGTGVQSITIPANQSSIDVDNLNIVLLENDYITIDITQASSAEDLYVILIYEV